MLKALDLTKIVVFESPRDPDKGTDKATKFKISAIPARVYSQIKDKATKYTQDENNPDGIKAEFKPHEVAYDIVKFGLKGIENYNVEFKTQKERIGSMLYEVAHEEVMAGFDIDTIRELHEAIKNICEFDAETEKNSEG